MDDFNKTPNIYPNLNAIPSNEQQFRLNKINEIKYYFLAEIRERELISKNLSKYIASLDYFDKSLNALFILLCSISIASFAIVIGAPAGKLEQVVVLRFPITWRFVNKVLKTIRNKKRTLKIIMLARSKLNSIESKRSNTLMDIEISREDFETIINEGKKYWELKERIRMMNSQRSDAENIHLIVEAKKWVLMKLLSVMKLLIRV